MRTIGYFFLVAMMISETAYAQIKIMPTELIEFAQKNGCSQVDDFFERKVGMVNPPYVYGYLAGPKEDSAAFWCQRHDAGERRFFLLIMHRRRMPDQLPADLKEVSHEAARCPNRLETANYPRGLEIYNSPRTTTLEGFIYVNNPKTAPPPDVKLRYNAILSSYDGTEELFYCYKGNWVVRFKH